ncbi:hypothetical protein V1504DRAFT_432619 [Lipomyces starkeyi]
MLKDPPVTLPRKGRPKGTRRLPTSSEIVQKAADRVENVRRCKVCKGTGHNKLTFPKVLKARLSAMANETEEDSLPAQNIYGEDGSQAGDSPVSDKNREHSEEDENDIVDMGVEDVDDVEFAEMWAGILP